MELKDSGTRRGFSTGAVRDGQQGKGRYELLPYFGVHAIARQMERGAAKYSARNWEKGMPLSVFLNSAQHHIAKLQAGFDDEPHLDAALWNLACLAEGQERVKRGLWPAELDDLPRTYAGQIPPDAPPAAAAEPVNHAETPVERGSAVTEPGL